MLVELSQVLDFRWLRRTRARPGRDGVPGPAVSGEESGRRQRAGDPHGAARRPGRVEQRRPVPVRRRPRAVDLGRRRPLRQLAPLLQRTRPVALPRRRPLQQGKTIPF